jgi:hypothetical protein
MAYCEKTDLFYPNLADVYYPIVENGAYGNLKKTWVLDRTIAIAVNPSGRKFKQDIQTNNAKLDLENAVLARTKNDLTQATTNDLYSMTNIIITNIRDTSGNLIYNESSGPRSGMATLFELPTFNPIVGAFGGVEYYKLVLARSENQAIDL